MTEIVSLRDRSTLIRAWRTFRERLKTATSGASSSDLLQAVHRHTLGLGMEAAKPVVRAMKTSHVSGLVGNVEQLMRASFVYRWLTAEPDPKMVIIDLRETLTLGWLVTLLNRLGKHFGPSFQMAAVHSSSNRFRTRLKERPLRTAGFVLIATSIWSGATRLAGPGLGSLSLAIYIFIALAGLACLRSQASWEDLRNTRTVQWLEEALAPPESQRSDGPTWSESRFEREESDSPNRRDRN